LLYEILKVYGPSHVVANGSEAVKAVRQALEAHEPYDLICLDILMPEMNGQEALQEIRQHEQDRGISSDKGAKIVMTSALNDHEEISNAYGNLCDAYLVKPIRKAVLLEELRNLEVIPTNE